MSVTKQLLELFRVDKQLRGLKGRLDQAEKFLNQQQLLLSELDKQKTTLETQLKQLRVQIAGDEGEAARIEAKVAALREQMNGARTAKEYSAFQNELNAFKEQKSQIETRVLESMGKADECAKQVDAIKGGHGDRVKIVANAQADRDKKAEEIKDRVAELTAQREQVAQKISARERAEFELLIKLRGDEAMAPVEIIDRKNHEYSCSACMMAVPVEAVSALLGGKLTHCPNCRSILYTEEVDFLGKDKASGKKPKAGAGA
jgi:uncharacterized protein